MSRCGTPYGGGGGLGGAVVTRDGLGRGEGGAGGAGALGAGREAATDGPEGLGDPAGPDSRLPGPDTTDEALTTTVVAGPEPDPPGDADAVGGIAAAVLVRVEALTLDNGAPVPERLVGTALITRPCRSALSGSLFFPVQLGARKSAPVTINAVAVTTASTANQALRRGLDRSRAATGTTTGGCNPIHPGNNPAVSSAERGSVPSRRCGGVTARGTVGSSPRCRPPPVSAEKAVAATEATVAAVPNA